MSIRLCAELKHCCRDIPCNEIVVNFCPPNINLIYFSDKFICNDIKGAIMISI